MIELYHVPIYAFSKEVFDKRIKSTEEKMRLRFDTIPEDILRHAITHETFPQRATLLNHIVGFVTVSFGINDLFFDVHLPDNMKRYVWTSRQKWHMRNMFASGTHFKLYDDMDNKVIQEKVLDMIEYLTERIIPRRFYIDKEQFKRFNRCLDYLALIDMARTELEASTNGKNENGIP